MKKFPIMIMSLVLAFGLMQPVAEACEQCQGKSRSTSVEDKFFKKIHMIYSYQKELDISDKQLDKITDLKVAFKKDLIQKKADIDVIKVDIRSQLYKDKIDEKAVNKLIDQKYDIKKAKSKKAVETYAQLKKILSREQMDKMEDMFREQKKAYSAKGSCKWSDQGSRKQ